MKKEKRIFIQCIVTIITLQLTIGSNFFFLDKRQKYTHSIFRKNQISSQKRKKSTSRIDSVNCLPSEKIQFLENVSDIFNFFFLSKRKLTDGQLSVYIHVRGLSDGDWQMDKNALGQIPKDNCFSITMPECRYNTVTIFHLIQYSRHRRLSGCQHCSGKATEVSVSKAIYNLRGHLVVLLFDP